MPEHLDNKLPKNWNTMPNRKLIIWCFHRISKRLDRLEQKANLQEMVVPENEPDMNKIKKPKKKRKE